MKALLFFGLVLLLIPAWVTLFTLPVKGGPAARSAGPLAVVEDALVDAGSARRVSEVTRLTPLRRADTWRLEGRAAAPGSEASGPRRFLVDLRTVCRPLSDAACWALDRLDFPPVDAVSAGPQIATPDIGRRERLRVVQEQLVHLGYDPGSPDGLMGGKTRESLEAFAASQGLGTGEDAIARAQVELELQGRRARAMSHLRLGELHAARIEYDEILRLDPESVDAHYNRGRIYDELALPGLAIAAYDATLAMRDDHAGAHRHRGSARFERGDYLGAVIDHARALRLEYLPRGKPPA